MPDLERVQQLTPLTLSQQWYESGAAVDPGTVTLGITRADGTELVAPLTATGGATTGPRTFNLTTTHTALLDRLTVTWTSTLKGTLVSYVEVGGGPLFSIAALQAELTTSTTTYTAAQIADARTYAETELETACGMAFVPRYGEYRGNGDGGYLFSIPAYPLRTVRWATVGGVALSAGEVTDLEVSPVGAVYGRSWTQGYGNIRVGFEYGYDYPPPGASEAARVLAKHQLVKGPIDERATQRASEFGPVNLATPGMFGSRFGIPVVDAFVESTRIPGIA